MDERPVVTAWIDAWNRRDHDALADLAATGYVHHAMTGEDLDLDGFGAGLDAVLAAFPDLRYVPGPVVAGEGLAATYLVATGTHTGPWLGLAGTGRSVTFRGSYLCRVVDGRIVEDWDVFDLLGPLLRLGGRLDPAPGADG